MVCSRVHEWLQERHDHNPAPVYCDKGGLNQECQRDLQSAESKSQRKKISKQYDIKRVEMERATHEAARATFPTLITNLLSLHHTLSLPLQQLEAACKSHRCRLDKMGVEERRQQCRVFYDGTSDSIYSNFKGFPFAVGAVGFAKGEQFFHIVKALLCNDLDSAVRMSTTTGGPALRRMGREVQNYHSLGQRWEEIDCGLVLLVNIIIKVAVFRSTAEGSRLLQRELAEDGNSGVHIVEGAKDDSRCGIGIHAEDSEVYARVHEWGRNQLGHACMAVAAYAAAAAAPPATGARSTGDAPGQQPSSSSIEEWLRTQRGVQGQVDKGTVAELAAKKRKQRKRGRGPRQDPSEAGKPIVGIDFGGVICGGAGQDGDEDTSMFGPSYLNTRQVDGSFAGVKALVSAVGAERVFIVSKAGESMRQKTLEWMDHNQFYALTGMPHTNVFFCKERLTKVPICELLGVTHFIDDRVDVLAQFSPDTTDSLPVRYLFPKLALGNKDDAQLARRSDGIIPARNWPHVVKMVLQG